MRLELDEIGVYMSRNQVRYNLIFFFIIYDYINDF